jgi:hypothetical protein
MRYIDAGNKNLRSAVDLLAEKRPLEAQVTAQKSQVVPKDSQTRVTDAPSATNEKQS